MQIVINVASNIVIYSGQEGTFAFNTCLTTATWMDNHITPNTHKIISDVTLPSPWRDSAYTYINGTFTFTGTPTEIEYVQIVQNFIDASAQAHGYDSIISACSYAGAANPYQTQGAAAIAWRGAVWAACYSVMSQVKAGTIPAPTIAALIAGLPVMVWP